MDRLKYIKDLIPQKFYNDLKISNTKFRNHPLYDVIRAIENPKNTPSPQSYANYTLDSIIGVSQEYNEWFTDKWNKKILSYKNDYNDSIGALAEIRALYKLINSGIKVTPIKEKNSPTPDFKIILENRDSAYFEVFCPRMNKSSRETLNDFYSIDHVKKKPFEIRMTSYNPIYSDVSSMNRIIDQIRYRLLRKANGKQTVENHCNILWIDLVSTEWGNTEKESTLPFFSKKS